MEEVLAIKPDMVFLWDEAWYAYNRFLAFPTACVRPWVPAKPYAKKYASEAYRAEYNEFKKKHGKIDPKNEKQLLNTHLLPDPDAVKDPSVMRRPRPTSRSPASVRGSLHHGE